MLIRSPARKSVNLSLNKELLTEAKDLGINMSRVAEESIAEAVQKRRSELWLAENRDAIEENNRYFEENGLPFPEYRGF
ncbi:MAG: type II toxin-antitoxin system CcdA family antitoxin [Rhizobiaceae bacterium]|nr:type II toxin-antitoxin system CcdA family antitoxin [Rhizobiaceae bacterium]